MFGGNVDIKNKISLIKATSHDLYDVICMLSMDGAFRSTRYQNTFLMPSAKMIRELEKWVEGDKDDKAVDALRSVLLKRQFAEPSALSGDVNTQKHGAHVLANPKTIASSLEERAPMIVLNARHKQPSCYVHFFGSKGEFPKTKPGGTSESAPLVTGAGVSGGGDMTPSRAGVAKITDHLKKGDAEHVLENFEKAVAGALAILHNTDKERFKLAKHFLSANPIVSWFFLTLPGRSDALVTADDLKDFAWRGVSQDQNSVIDDAKETHYDQKEITAGLHKIKQVREDLMSADKVSLIPKILRAYKAHKPSLSFFEKNLDLKILMDEVLFLHDGSASPRPVSDCLADLEAIDWSRPKHFWVICNSEIYDKMLLRATEAFNSGCFVSHISSLKRESARSLGEHLLHLAIQALVEWKLLVLTEPSGGAV